MTALYALRLARGAGPQSHLATVSLRWTDPNGGDEAEVSREVRTSDLARTFGASNPYFRFDAIVASTAEVLRGSEFTANLGIRDIADVANREAELLPATAEVHAFLDMLTNLGRLRD